MTRHLWQPLTDRAFRLRAVLALLAMALVPTASAHASSFQVTPAGGATFPERALLVSGSGIPALSAKQVHIIENGVPVNALTVRSLKQPSAHDFGVVLVIDISPNATAIEHAVAAAVDLAGQRPAQEELGIVEADATPPVALNMTRDTAAIKNALSTAVTVTHHGETLTQAALTGVQLLQSAKIGAGTVIVLSDGADQGTPATLRELISAADTAHVRIFGVGIRSNRFNPRALAHITSLGGGQLYEEQSSQLRSALDAIESGLESQYLIHYYSVQGPGKQIPASIRIDGVPGIYNISYTSPTLTSAKFKQARPQSSFWTSTLAVLIIPVICALLLVGGGLFFVRRRAAVHERVGAFLPPPPDAEAVAGLDSEAGNRRLLDRTQRAFEGRRWWATFQEEAEITQIKQSPIELVGLTLAGSVLAGVILYVLTGSAIAGVLAALACPVLAWIAFRHQLHRQQRLFGEQLGEHLQEVAAAMRAGRSFTDALVLVTETSTDPTRREFERALADERLGMPLDEALAPIEQRMASKDMEQVVLVAALDRTTGASTADVLDRVADGVRENAELRRELRALTAQVSLSRWILTALPIAVLILISLDDSAYEYPMYHTTLGVLLLILSGISVIAGSLVMRQLAKIDF